jgi:hypothetical protein
VRVTSDALALLEEILSIEVLMANDLLASAQGPPGAVAVALGAGTGELSAMTRAALDGLGEDRSPAEAQRTVASALFGA